MNLRTVLFALVFTAAGVTSAHAGSVVASGPLAVSDGHQYSCTVVNAGTKDLASVKVDVSVAGSTLGSGTSNTCAPLAAVSTCAASNQAGSAQYRYCSVEVVGSAKAVRGRFCNLSSGECVDLH